MVEFERSTVDLSLIPSANGADSVVRSWYGPADYAPPMSNVTVVATFTIIEGREEDALEALRPVIEQTHDEAGCLSYALHRDKNDPKVLVLVERWTSQIALDNHFLQPYVAGLGSAAAELLSEPPTVRFCAPIPVGDPIKGVL